MSKVMLIMDNPNACIECPLRYESEEISIGVFEYKRLYSCRKAPDYAEDIYLEDILHKKPDWCPLKEVPERKKHTIFPKSYDDGWNNEFNACIYEILKNGETE